MAEQGTSVDWHAIDPASALERLDSSDQGLSQAEAQTRLQQHGANALPPAPPEPECLESTDDSEVPGSGLKESPG